jgi:hypothetical protein
LVTAFCCIGAIQIDLRSVSLFADQRLLFRLQFPLLLL